MNAHDPEISDIKDPNGFKAVFQHATIGILVVDEEGTVELSNPHAEQLFDYHNGQLWGESIELLFPEDPFEQYKENGRIDLSSFSRGSSAGEFQTYAQTQEEEEIPVEVSITSFQLNGKNRAVIFVNDITERNIFMEELRQEEERFRSTIENMLEGCQLIDFDWRYIYLNDMAARHNHLIKEEVVGKTLMKVMPGFENTEVFKVMEKCMDDRISRRTECFVTYEDDETGWFDLVIQPVNEGIFVLSLDITERKEAEKELQQLNLELEERVRSRTNELSDALEREERMNELKSAFVSMASHEFRTPLTSILTSASLIERYSHNGEYDRQGRHIERIRASVNNLMNILTDFLSLDKLEQGIIEKRYREFHLPDFLNEVTTELDGIRKEGQNFNLSHSGDEEILLDEKILRNVMLNLLSNAIKYSEKDVDLISNVDKEEVTISVVDKGIGIPDIEQEKMFGKFFRASNVSNIQGTGLGMNIVKRYVELQDGNIHFESQEGIGTTFTVQFPNNKNIEE